MADAKKNVLVVDDEPDVCEYLATLLQDNGYRTVTAKDGTDALEKVKACTPDLITLDITMPEKSGVRFYRDIKESEQYKQIPIIVVTGVTGDFQKFISTRSQVPAPDGYLSKPIDRDKILEMIRHLV